jgi:hypothetical protein
MRVTLEYGMVAESGEIGLPQYRGCTDCKG